MEGVGEGDSCFGVLGGPGIATDWFVVVADFVVVFVEAAVVIGGATGGSELVSATGLACAWELVGSAVGTENSLEPRVANGADAG